MGPRGARLGAAFALIGACRQGPSAAARSGDAGAEAPIARRLGVVSVGDFAVTYTFNAHEEAGRWQLAIDTDAQSPEAAGSLGPLWRTSAVLGRAEVATLRRAVEGLSVASRPVNEAQAVFSLSGPAWPLSGVAGPDRSCRALYTAPGAAVMAMRALDGRDLSACAASAPPLSTWIAETLERPSGLAADAPVHPPVFRGIELPGGLSGSTADALAAWSFAVFTGQGLALALRHSLRGVGPGHVEALDQRFLTALHDNTPPQLGEDFARYLGARGDAAAGVEGADVIWGHLVGTRIAAGAVPAATLRALATECAVNTPSPAHCTPWRIGALIALSGRSADPALARLAVTAALNTAARFTDRMARAITYIDALRMAHGARDPGLEAAAALGVFAAPEEAPVSVRGCVHANRDQVLAACGDARLVAAAMLVERCAPAVVSAARASLVAPRAMGRVPGACLLRRCVAGVNLAAELERANPRDRLNAVVAPLVPAWCERP
ncbi:MAG: hypothetical protein JNK72_11425 [Myxococcales bacterium]|nr:hypothetical protein [Myxococcales bacterium]